MPYIVNSRTFKINPFIFPSSVPNPSLQPFRWPSHAYRLQWVSGSCGSSVWLWLAGLPGSAASLLPGTRLLPDPLVSCGRKAQGADVMGEPGSMRTSIGGCKCKNVLLCRNILLKLPVSKKKNLMWKIILSNCTQCSAESNNYFYDQRSHQLFFWITQLSKK